VPLRHDPFYVTCLTPTRRFTFSAVWPVSFFNQFPFKALTALCCLLLAELALSADAIPGEEYCDRPIHSIIFAGNKKTKPQVLLREIKQQVGETCSIDEIVDSIQNIMDLGLFNSVVADMALINDDLQLQFSVKEKLYFLIIPRISRTADAEIRGGVQLRFDNFLGRLHELRITSESRKENDGEGPGGYVHRLNYNIPRFLGSNHGLGFDVGTDRRALNLEREGLLFGTAQSETQTLGMQFSRWVNQSKGVQGLRYFFGFRYRTRQLDIKSGEAGPYVGGDDMALIMGFENKQIRQDLYRRRGTLVGARLTSASESTGSDFTYTRADIYAAGYYALPNGIRNINVQGRLGLSNGAAFGESSYSLGGGQLLRGMKPGTISGELMALVNAEYLHASFNYPQLRWVIFGDVGNVVDSNENLLLNVRARVGLGMRFKLLALSNTDLRLDVAYDPRRERVQAYFSSNLTF